MLHEKIKLRGRISKKRALREWQPRREVGERKATDLLTREVAGLPNSDGGKRMRPHRSAVLGATALFDLTDLNARPYFALVGELGI